MADQTQSNNNQVIMYALIAIAVLLAAIVAFMVLKPGSVPSPTVSGAATTPATTGTNGATTPQMPPASTPVAFDTKTATKLPSGMTPEQALKTYNEDVLAGKFTEAYNLLPLDKKTSYGSADAYGQQVKAYGITSYKIGKATTTGSDVSIAAEQVTPQMPITYTWVFTKDGGNWYVKSRTMGGSVQ
jgi:hypothetical protein